MELAWYKAIVGTRQVRHATSYIAKADGLKSGYTARERALQYSGKSSGMAGGIFRGESYRKPRSCERGLVNRVVELSRERLGAGCI